MEQIIQQYIQAKGLNEQQAQQLIQELQQLDEQQLQQVIENMQQQLQGNNQEEQMMQYGGIPVSMDGLYEYENTPVIVPNGNITMEGIDYPVDAYNADTGEFLETMYPDEDYNFDANNVLEIPKGKFGISKMQSGGNRGTKGVRSLRELKNLRKSKNKKEQIAEGEDRFLEALKNFRKSLDEDVIKKGYDSKYSGKFKKILRGTGGIFPTLFETSPWAQMFIQESSTSPTQKPTQEPIDKTTAFKLREQGFNVPDSLIEGYEKSSTTIPLKSNEQNNFVTNYFKQPESKYQLPSKFNISTTTPVQNQNISTSTNENRKKDEYPFVSDLSKVSKKSRKDNIADYQSWTDEWSKIISNFKSLPYNKQQEAVLNWMKKNPSGLNYDNVIQQLKNWGYTQNPESLLKDGKFAEGTNLMRPSNLIGKEDPLPLVEDVVFPNANTNQQSSVQEIPEVALPKEEGVDESNDEVNMDDVVLGKLNNNDYSGRYLSNMKLRNNIIKLPYFGRTDLKIPGVYTQNISPYLNEIYSVNNAYKQNTDLNSAIGQAAQMQLGANTMDRINKISGSVYNNNQQQKVNWENSLAGIYNQQQQVDEQNRRNYDDDVNRTITNKQNIDNIIDRMAYEFKQTRIRNKNNMLLSQMLHPNYVITDDGTMIRKPSPFNKGYADYLQEQNEKLSKENEELKTRVAKYGIKRRKK